MAEFSEAPNITAADVGGVPSRTTPQQVRSGDNPSAQDCMQQHGTRECGAARGILGKERAAKATARSRPLHARDRHSRATRSCKNEHDYLSLHPYRSTARSGPDSVSCVICDPYKQVLAELDRLGEAYPCGICSSALHRLWPVLVTSRSLRMGAAICSAWWHADAAGAVNAAAALHSNVAGREALAERWRRARQTTALQLSPALTAIAETAGLVHRGPMSGPAIVFVDDNTRTLQGFVGARRGGVRALGGSMGRGGGRSSSVT